MTAPALFGPLRTSEGVTFRLWAPAARSVDVLLDKPVPMTRRGDWFFATVPGAEAGTRYSFRIDGELDIPDPGSHFQPDDVAGPSEVIDHDFAWQTEWRGRPWEDCVFLEAHVGTFTPQGIYRAIIDKLEADPA